ncbi:MAG: L-threonylcarbamoyladenylate synthase [Bauldia litoralis]
MTAPSDPARIETATDAAIARAGSLLRAGRLVAFPTETVYGLGADATDDRAVASIFAAKGRPRFNPLIVHAPDRATHEVNAVFDRRARAVADRFWPGALTLVLPRRADAGLSLLVSAGLETVAVRVPDHPVARALMAAAARPIAAPSANRSGAVSPTTAAHVAASLGTAVDLILDGGACPGGLESTVLDLTGATPRILRPGLVPRGEIEAEVGPVGVSTTGDPVAAPGMLESHYAPDRPVRLNATAPAGPGEALLAFGAPVPAGFARVENLSASGELVEAAANLFRLLHALDDPAVSAIAVMPIPEEGLGEAINDRLRRAAAERG